MKTGRKGQIAVLTGDIVRSSDLSAKQLDRLFRQMRNSIDEILTWPRARAHFERYRGDGWQVVLSEPRLSLRAALFLRASLRAEGKGFETRIAVGIGSVNSLKWDDLGGSEGEAFRLSGQLLDELKNPWLMDLRVGREAAVPHSLLEAVFGLCDVVAYAWTPRQAEVMKSVLSPDAEVQDEIGERLGITQSTVAQHFKKAGGRAIEKALGAFEQGISWDAG